MLAHLYSWVVPLYVYANVWCIKIRTKDSSKTLLSLVRILMHQTLVLHIGMNWTRAKTGYFKFLEGLYMGQNRVLQGWTVHGWVWWFLSNSMLIRVQMQFQILFAPIVLDKVINIYLCHNITRFDGMVCCIDTRTEFLLE